LANLAATFGAAGLSTLVVDAEVRRPVMHSIFDLPKAPGLSDLLLTRSRDGALASVERMTPRHIHPDGVFHGTNVSGVTLLPSGKRLRQEQWERSGRKCRLCWKISASATTWSWSTRRPRCSSTTR